MAAHLQRCPHKCKACPYCAKSFSCLLINHHYKSCRFRPILCPNKCRRQPFRYCDMYAHLHRDCPEESMECIYYATGCSPDCTGKVRRADYHDHTQDRDNMNIAIAGLFRQVDALKEEVRSGTNCRRGGGGGGGWDNMSSNVNGNGRLVEECGQGQGQLTGRKRSMYGGSADGSNSSGRQ
eukprot:gene34611-42695_t